MIDFGDVYPARVLITDDAGALANATTVTLTITQPDGVAATITNPIAPASTGTYTYNFTATQAGRHTVRWVAIGTNASSFTDTFDVDESAPTGIVSLADAKAHLNKTSTTDDEEVRFWLDVTTDWVEGRVGPVVRRTVVQTLKPNGGPLFLEAPVVSLASVVAAHGHTDTYVLADMYLDGPTGIVEYGATGGTFRNPVTVTYVAGRAIVPPAIRAAALLLLKSLWETQRASGGEPQFQGGVDDVAELPGMGLAVWKAEKLLERYRLAPVVA